MAFLNTSSALTLSALGVREQLDASVRPASTGWDTCQVTFATRLGELSTAALTAATSVPRGTPLLGTTLYATEVSSACAGGGIWLINVQGKGMVGPRPVRISGGATVVTTSPENLQIGATIYPKSEVADAAPAVDREYITTSAPPTNQVGLAGSPGSAPAVRGTLWGGIPNPTYHYPNGWVLQSVVYEQLLNLSVWLVTERWEYKFAFTP